MGYGPLRLWLYSPPISGTAPNSTHVNEHVNIDTKNKLGYAISWDVVWRKTDFPGLDSSERVSFYWTGSPCTRCCAPEKKQLVQFQPCKSTINHKPNNGTITNPRIDIPSGKHIKTNVENQHLSWVNPLFLWQCSIAKCSLTRPGIHHKPKNRDSDRQHFILGKSSISGRISSHVSWIGWLVDVRPVFVVLETNLGVMICKLCVFSGQYGLQGVTSMFDHVFKVISMCWFHIIWVAVVLPFYHPCLLIHFHGLPWISPCFCSTPLGVLIFIQYHPWWSGGFQSMGVPPVIIRFIQGGAP